MEVIGKSYYSWYDYNIIWKRQRLKWTKSKGRKKSLPYENSPSKGYHRRFNRTWRFVVVQRRHKKSWIFRVLGSFMALVGQVVRMYLLFGLCRRRFDVIREPCLWLSVSFQDLHEIFVRLTSPSSKPSPVVAQLGTTYHILSFSWLSFRASVTSCGFIAAQSLISV